MNSYDLIVEEKVSVWRYTHIITQANSEKEAISNYFSGNYDTEESEYIPETEEVIESDKEPTLEIYDRNYRLLYRE